MPISLVITDYKKSLTGQDRDQLRAILDQLLFVGMPPSICFLPEYFEPPLETDLREESAREVAALLGINDLSEDLPGDVSDLEEGQLVSGIIRDCQYDGFMAAYVWLLARTDDIDAAIVLLSEVDASNTYDETISLDMIMSLVETYHTLLELFDDYFKARHAPVSVLPFCVECFLRRINLEIFYLHAMLSERADTLPLAAGFLSVLEMLPIVSKYRSFDHQSLTHWG